MAMVLCECVHPPGGATSLIAVIGSDKVHRIGYWYVLFPSFIGSVLHVAAAIAINNVSEETFEKRHYPQQLVIPSLSHLSNGLCISCVSCFSRSRSRSKEGNVRNEKDVKNEDEEDEEDQKQNVVEVDGGERGEGIETVQINNHYDKIALTLLKPT